MTAIIRASVLLLCLLALKSGRSENQLETMDRLKVFENSASFPKHLRKEFIGGFLRKPLLSDVGVSFFTSMKKGVPEQRLKINTPIMPNQVCYNISSPFECNAPFTYARHVLDNPDTFLNTSLAAFVRRVICKRLLFNVMKSKNVAESIKVFDLHLFCPNPCRDGSKRPCADRKAISDQCMRSNTLIYDNSFYCRCDKFMRWSSSFQMCVQDPSERSGLIPNCGWKGTKMIEKTGYSFRCVCKEGIAGLKCDKVVDSCLSRFGGHYSQPQFRNKYKGGLAGRAACRSLGTANRCVPFKQQLGVVATIGLRPFVAYSCICQRPFLPDPELPFPNCLKRGSACDVLACVHGRCTSVGSVATCSCDRGWSGPLCNSAEQEQSFLEWSAWSTCVPLCGAQRFRFRVRRCLVTSCKEPGRQTRPCRPRACFRYFIVDRFLDAMKARDKATDVIFDFGFLTVWFFCATILVAATYAALLLTGPFLDRVANTQRVASFLTWWRAKREKLVSQLHTVRQGRQ